MSALRKNEKSDVGSAGNQEIEASTNARKGLFWVCVHETETRNKRICPTVWYHSFEDNPLKDNMLHHLTLEASFNAIKSPNKQECKTRYSRGYQIKIRTPGESLLIIIVVVF